jgi:hypothetical protein
MLGGAGEYQGAGAHKAKGMHGGEWPSIFEVEVSADMEMNINYYFFSKEY